MTSILSTILQEAPLQEATFSKTAASNNNQDPLKEGVKKGTKSFTQKTREKNQAVRFLLSVYAG